MVLMIIAITVLQWRSIIAVDVADTDVNECSSSPSPCTDSQLCLNSYGSYVCLRTSASAAAAGNCHAIQFHSCWPASKPTIQPLLVSVLQHSWKTVLSVSWRMCWNRHMYLLFQPNSECCCHHYSFHEHEYLDTIRVKYKTGIKFGLLTNISKQCKIQILHNTILRNSVIPIDII